MGVCVLLAGLVAPPALAGQSINANSNGISVRSDTQTYLACSGGVAYVFEAGGFAVISPDEIEVPVCIDYRQGRLHNFSGGLQSGDCRQDVMSDAQLCSGPLVCANVLEDIDLAGCW